MNETLRKTLEIIVKRLNTNHKGMINARNEELAAMFKGACIVLKDMLLNEFNIRVKLVNNEYVIV